MKQRTVPYILPYILSNIEKNKIAELKIRDIAEIGGLIGEYDSAYKYFCDSIHVNVRDYQKYLKLNDLGEVSQIALGPDLKEIKIILLTAIEFMISVIKVTSNVLSIKNNIKFNEICEKADCISNKYKHDILREV